EAYSWRSRPTVEEGRKGLEDSRKAVKLFERLAAGRRDPEAARDLALAYFNLGVVSFHLGDKAEARGAFARAVKLREPLPAADPEAAQAQAHLAAASLHLGAVGLYLGDGAAVRNCYPRVLAILRSLEGARFQPVRPRWDQPVAYKDEFLRAGAFVHV